MIPEHLRTPRFFLVVASIAIPLGFAAWQALLNNIVANDGADSSHTLNSLDLTMPNGCVKSDNELRRAAFFQYHLSLQAFFDASARVDTTFA